MSGLAVCNMASVPSWSQSSSTSSEEVDRLRTGSTWRREFGERNRVNTDTVIMNGIRSNSDDLDYGRSAMDNNMGKQNQNDSDHISSVHNNPFFKTYGIRTQRPDSRGDEIGGLGSVTLRSVNFKDSDGVFDEDEPQEYRPGSGFVHKLMGKFSSLTTREENNYRPKRTSSLENLLDDPSRRDSSIKDDVPRRISGSLSKSVENVTNTGRTLRPLRVPISSGRSNSDSSERKGVTKSPREGSDAPFLARDDIIIIEKEPIDRPEPKTTQQPDSPGKFNGPQVVSLKDDSSNIDELPKPNTVLSVRSIFEKSAPSAPIPIVSTATGPVVLSPTANLKAPPFSSQKAVSKVPPSVSTESAQTGVTNKLEQPAEKPKKRMAPQPPVQKLQQPEPKTALPMPKPRSKQSPVIAVAPFINETSTTDQEMDTTNKTTSLQKTGDDSNGVWPEEYVAKVFDSSAIIKQPIAPARSSHSKQYSGSAVTESNRSVTNSKTDSSFKDREQKKAETQPVSNGNIFSSSYTAKSESSKPDSSLNSIKTTNSSSKSETGTGIGFSANIVESDKSSSKAEQNQSRSEPSPRIEMNIPYDSKLEQIFPSEKPVSDLDTLLDLQNVDETPIEILPEGKGPIKGIPRVIAERLKKDGNKTGHHQTSVVNSSASQEDNNIQSTMSKFEGDVVSGRKRKNNTPIEDKAEPRDTTNNEILNFRKNLKSVSDSKASKVSQVFDTSQIVRKPVNHVPRLDLTGITDDQRNGFYQEGYKPTEIKPCTILFIGAGVKVGRSMLEKNRTDKGKITFSDAHNETFEYPSEEVYLEEYLAAHPNEPAEILILEDISSSMTESSDDSDAAPQTPRGGSSSDTEETLKSNTALSHSGGLSNYKSKYQMEYTFGAAMEEPEAPTPPPPQPKEEESDQIIPADEDITWSTETNADLLF